MKAKMIYLAIALMLAASLPAAAQEYTPYKASPQSYAPEAFQKTTTPFQNTEIQKSSGAIIYQSNGDGNLTGDPNNDGIALGDVTGGQAIPVRDCLPLILFLALTYGSFVFYQTQRVHKRRTY